MSEWRRFRVDEIRVILLVPGMELEDQLTVAKHTIIAIAMLMLGKCVDSQQPLIPAAACPDVAHSDQRLRLNTCTSRPMFCHLLVLPCQASARVAVADE